jgi:hypothetical protein
VRRTNAMQDESEDLVIDGCPVRVTFTEVDTGWAARAVVTCGLGENRGERVVNVDACPTREKAEQAVLAKVQEVLGGNVDRNTSRVRNWS